MYIKQRENYGNKNDDNSDRVSKPCSNEKDEQQSFTKRTETDIYITTKHKAQHIYKWLAIKRNVKENGSKLYWEEQVTTSLLLAWFKSSHTQSETNIPYNQAWCNQDCNKVKFQLYKRITHKRCHQKEYPTLLESLSCNPRILKPADSFSVTRQRYTDMSKIIN